VLFSTLALNWAFVLLIPFFINTRLLAVSSKPKSITKKNEYNYHRSLGWNRIRNSKKRIK
jgi:hypothetical protein